MSDLPRRGLKREEAAIYIGIGVTKFDELVKDGRMPHPKRIDGRKVWDRLALDAYFDRLPDDQDHDAIFEACLARARAEPSRTRGR